jgi:hypothetical protein
MKRLAFVIGGAAALALGACSGNNQDAVQNAELNQPGADDLNALSNQAAMDANSESTAPGNQQNLSDENAAAQENAANGGEAEEQNVSAM